MIDLQFLPFLIGIFVGTIFFHFLIRGAVSLVQKVRSQQTIISKPGSTNIQAKGSITIDGVKIKGDAKMKVVDQYGCEYEINPDLVDGNSAADLKRNTLD